MIAKTIFVEHEIGDVVYLKTDKEQLPRMVVWYVVNPSSVLYELQYSSYTSTTHSNFEITKEKDKIIVME